MSSLIIPENRRGSSTGAFKRDYAQQFFQDKERLIDYIIVYKTENADNPKKKLYLDVLMDIGAELEEVKSLLDTNINFIKVHMPKNIIVRYAEKYDIPLTKFQISYIRPPVPKLKCLRNELTSQNRNSPNFQRAPDTFSGDQPKHSLRQERCLVTYNILKRIPFGERADDIGIHHLLDKQIIAAAYAPHDGTSKWNDAPNDPLNDRQLLRRYWSSPKNFFKAQPLDVIERYFGDNIALYFAWLSFYNKMLTAPIIAGTIVSSLNFLVSPKFLGSIEGICESDKILCPRCKFCRAWLLKDTSCMRYHITYALDNIFTIVFAVFMTFWAAIYLVLWKRKEAVLAIRWNIQDSFLEESDVRPEFEKFAKHTRITDFGESELYIPTWITLWRKCFSIIACIVMVCGVAYVHYTILHYESQVSTRYYYSLPITFACALLTLSIIAGLRSVCISMYEPIVHWLVDLEIPETQTQFDNSYILKICVFSFVNNYTSLMYCAFFKGKFYTHPDDPHIYNNKNQLVVETCDPSGCAIDVFINIFVLVVFLPTINKMINYVVTNFALWWRSTVQEGRAHIKHFDIPRWEKDYELTEIKPTDLLQMYEEMVIEFGFVTMFAFAFPCAPIIALINNVFKIHIDAHNLVVKYRRPQSKRSATVGAWITVANFLTYVSIFTNACYMMYTSNFMTYFYYPSETYVHRLLNYTLSEYEINLDHWPRAGVPNGTKCYYPGSRHPPNSLRPYALTSDYYILNLLKAFFIILYEHIIWLLTVIISYAIPSLPSFVRERNAVTVMETRRSMMQRTGSFL